MPEPHDNAARRRSAREAMEALAAGAPDAHARLTELLAADLRGQCDRLPPGARAGMGGPDAGLDACAFSLRRHIVGQWHSWLAADASMPALLRRVARTDETALHERCVRAGLIHLALIAAALDPARRVRLLSILDQPDADRVLQLLRRCPEPAPRREVVKARLHALLTRAESRSPRDLPASLGRDALAAFLAALPPAERTHVQRTWPPDVYNEIAALPTDAEPDWRLSAATWARLWDQPGGDH